MRFLFRLIAPWYSRLLGLVAYGPWGFKLHQLIISIFRRIYKIEDLPLTQHRRLGDYFLRDRYFQISKSELVAPAECRLMEGPLPVDLSTRLSIKKLEYSWSDFPEFKDQNLEGFYFWNFYLAPYHYHWVHSACGLQEVKAMRIAGDQFPVNALGRKICPRLYAQNERLSFRGTHPQVGRVYHLCVGAMGVSRIRSDLGQVDYANWQNIPGTIRKAQRIAGFELGSSVLLVVEKPGEFLKEIGPDILVGQALLKN